METEQFWSSLGRRIGRMGPPQVPGPALAAQARALCGGGGGLTVLLGVTPAYVGIGDRLLAFDAAAGMIAALWPGDTGRQRAAVADWRELPLPDGAARQVIGDGSLNAVPDRAVLCAVLSETRRILAPDGRAVVRVFVRPEGGETLDQVLAAAREGRIGSLNVLRWRLAAALAVAPGYRAAVRDILAAAERLGDLEAFARETGMDPAEAEHLRAYRDQTATYVFPDRDALAADALAAGLACDWVETAGYPGARDCPFAVLRHRER